MRTYNDVFNAPKMSEIVLERIVFGGDFCGSRMFI